VAKFATEYNLSVVRESAARRSVILAGTVANFNQAFGVSLETYAYPNGTYPGLTGPVQVPVELATVVEGVFGLDNRPVAKRHSSSPHAAADGPRPFTAEELGKIYNFPQGSDGSGQTIGIIELGGGYRPSDLDAYFSNLGLPTPTVIPVSVDGGTNAPSSANSDDAEVVRDIQVAGAAAPGAKFVVYFAPNDAASNGFLDAVTKAIHDTENNPSIISISWGGPEDTSTTNFQVQFDKALQAAALLGITVCVAAGDNGAADVGPKAWDGKAHVDFPSASPFALSCGGTRLITENGASAVAPLWAALIALINQKLKGRIGFVNPQLYALPAGSGAFHDVSMGNNRVSFQQFKNVGYDAAPGWDAASGLGSPDGTALSRVLKAGAPGTASAASRGGTPKGLARPKVSRSSGSPHRSPN
jgi:kumamolisin